MSSRRVTLALIFLIAIVGCEPESPTSVAPDQAAVAASRGGPPGGFQNVQVRPQVAAQARGPVTNNLADAVDRVASGGTIVVHPGEYVTEDVVVDKPVTIVGDGDPVIVNAGASTSLAVSGVVGGPVVIRGLTFRDESGTHEGTWAASIALDQDFAEVRVEESSFSGVPGETRSIFQRTPAPSVSPRVVVRNSTFRDGNRAVHLQNSFGLETRYLLEGNDVQGFSSRGFFLTFARGTVRDNDFALCSFSCVLSQVGTHVEILDNRFQSCTANLPDPRPSGLGAACIFFFFGEEGIVRGNHLSDRTTDRGYQAPILVINPAGFGQSGSFLVESNVIDGCGMGSCIASDGGTRSVIRDNHIVAYAVDHTAFGISSRPLFGPGHDIIENNVLQGVSAPGVPDPLEGPEFAFEFGGIRVTGPNSAVISGNTVSHTTNGLALDAAATVEGTDNRISLVRHFLSLSGEATASIRFSDFTDLLISPVWTDGSAVGADLTCNWWGTSEGPTIDPPIANIDVEPFSTTPIAGTGRTTCSGTFPSTLVTYEARFEVTTSRYFGSDPTIAAELPPVGEQGSVLVRYDPSVPGSGSSPTVYAMDTSTGSGGPELSFVFDGGLMWVTVAGDHFEARVFDRDGGADVLRFQSDDAEVPITGLTTDFVYLSFGDLSGNAISDESLPTTIDLADWPSTNNLDLRAVDDTNSEFRIFGKVTSLTRVN